MNDLIIKNVFAVLPDRVTDTAISVLVRDGRIAEIDTNTTDSSLPVVDGNGGYLFAGFIDCHVHGGGGADFMDATVEAFETVTVAHLKHGTTMLIPTSMTATSDELEAFIKTYLQFINTERKGAKTLGLHFEGPYLSGAGAKSRGAQRGDLLRFPDMDEVKKLYELADGYIVRWDAAPELPGSLELAEFLSSNGILCSEAHSAAVTDEAEAGFKAGFSHVTHFYNAVTTYRKVDQSVLDGIVEAAYLNDKVVVELICDGCHIPKGVLKLALKIKGPEKVCAITDAMRIAGTDMKSGLLGNTTSGSMVVVDDGVAKLPDLTSFAGSIATTDRCLRVLCQKYGISMTDASKMLSLAPAKLHKIDKDYGSIEVGKVADLVITEKSLNVISVILDGLQKFKS